MFDLNKEASVKLNIHTLICNAMLQRLSHMRMVALDADLQTSRYERFFNEFLDSFLSIEYPATPEIGEAVEHCVLELKLVASKVRSQRQGVDQSESLEHLALIIEEIAQDLWSGEDEEHFNSRHADYLEQLRAYAQQLAIEFYECPRYPHPVATSTSALIDIKFEGQRNKGGRTSNLLACEISAEKVQCQDDKIIFCFSFHENFDDFLSYLFLFLHEYTAHLYAKDNGYNDILHDGWLFYAAAWFLRRKQQQLIGAAYQYNCPVCANVDPPPFSHLDSQQAGRESYAAKLLQNKLGPAQGFQVAREFAALVDWECFACLTKQLAWFEPQQKENGLTEPLHWPTWFIRCLEVELNAAANGKPDLSQKLSHVASQLCDVREIMEYLKKTPAVSQFLHRNKRAARIKDSL